MSNWNAPSVAAAGYLGDSTSPHTLDFGIALVSFAALLFELTLPRLYAVVLYYHFSFLAIAVALLGLGTGGVVAYLMRWQLRAMSLRSLAAWLSLLASLLTAVSLVVILRESFSLDLNWHTFGHLLLIYLFSAFPFAAVGLFLSVVFSRQAPRKQRLYSADLAGGALACLVVVPLVNAIGAPNAVLLSALVLALAAAIWSDTLSFRVLAVVLVALLAVLAVANHGGRLFDIASHNALRADRGVSEHVRWNALSRVEIDHDFHGHRTIVLDANAASAMPDADPFAAPVPPAAPTSTASLVNILRPNGAYAIIGPGGGNDVLRAVRAGSPSVSLIEPNPVVAHMLRSRYAADTHRLFLLPQVHVDTSDIRVFLRRSPSQFDVIQLPLIATAPAVVHGAYDLHESTLFTVEAFRRYFSHLKPDGILSVAQWEFQYPRQALRTVATAIDALHSLGVADPSYNIIVISQGHLTEDGRAVYVLARRTAFTRDEEQSVFDFLRQRPDLALIFSPHDRAEATGMQPADPSIRWNPFTSLLVSNDPAGFVRRYAYNVAPVHDAAPFFFFTQKPLQLFGSSPLRPGIQWSSNFGFAVLLMTLAISVIAVAGCLIIPLVVLLPARRVPLPRMMYFALTGLGFALVEVAFLERFISFLGNPTDAFTVLIFLVVLASGFGNLASWQWLQDARGVLNITILVAVMAALSAGGVSLVLRTCVSWPFPAKLVASFLVLAPLAFASGFAFPAGLREIALRNASGDAAVEWAWALNAGAGVLGAVLAMVLVLTCGPVVTVFCGAVVYAVAGVCSRCFPLRLA